MTRSRMAVPKICKLLQPLTQNGIIPAYKASYIVSEFMRGNVQPAQELTSSKDVPAAFLPIINELKEEVEACLVS